MKLPTFLVLLLLPAVAGRAEIIGWEPFSYRGTVIAGANGGAFWDYRNDASPGHTGAGSDWDVAPGFGAVSAWSGGLLFTADSGVMRQFNGPDAAGETAGAVNDGSAAKKVYASVRMTRGTGAPWCGISFFDGAAERLFFGLFPDSTGKFTIYDQNTFTRMALSTTDVTVGRTWTLVAKVDYQANVVTLYADPDFTRTEASNTPVATAAFTATAGTSALRLGSGAGGLVQWDDLLVTTTWESLRSYEVTSTADSGAGSLRAACALAGAVGARVTFAPLDEQYTIRLTGGEIAFTGVRGVVLDGPEGTQVSIAGGPGRIFRTGSSAALSVRNLTLMGGNAAVNTFPNRAGGAISAAGMLSVDRCTFTANNAEAGGAIQSTAVLKVNRSTFAGNSVESYGGAIFADPGSSAEITHCTFAGNTGRGAVGVEGGSLALKACVLTGSRYASETADVWRSGAAGTSLTAEASVITNIGTVPLSETAANRNLLGSTLEPLPVPLAPLGDYGGATRTMPPLPGSPSVDRAAPGIASSGDQRRLAITGAPDAGAAEYQGKADLARYWNTDWDGDGAAYGVEQGAGSDPLSPGTGAVPVLDIARTGAGEPRISFRRVAQSAIPVQPAALAWTRWRVKRTATPGVASSWETIHTFDGPAATATTAPGVGATTVLDVPANGTATVHLTDLTPNPARLFYRLEVELVP